MRALLTSTTFLRLWAIGGCVNAMRWFEVLAAALFTLDVTDSGLAVAVVSAARTLPMLFLGAFAGVMAEAVNRKRVLLIGQFVASAASATVAMLALLGAARPWHVAVAALIAGTVWSTEMSTRRRMVGECVPTALVPRALALDTLTNSITRMIGPIVAGTLYQFTGLAGAFTVSALLYLLAAILAIGAAARTGDPQVRTRQCAARPRRGRGLRARPRGHCRRAAGDDRDEPAGLSLLGTDCADRPRPLHGVAGAGGHDGGSGVVRRVPWRTVAGRRRSARQGAYSDGRRIAAVPGLRRADAARAAVLAGLRACWSIGGFGSAAFANMQTSLIITSAPPHIRSRLMGLLTVCIGAGPLGILLVGALAALLGPLGAVDAIELSGLAAVAAAGSVWRRREQRQPALVAREV